MGQSKTHTKGYWSPNTPHCGSDLSNYTNIYYVPSQKKFIAVGVHRVFGHSAGSAGDFYSATHYLGAKEITRDEAKKHANPKTIAFGLANPSRISVKSLKTYDQCPISSPKIA